MIQNAPIIKKTDNKKEKSNDNNKTGDNSINWKLSD